MKLQYNILWIENEREWLDPTLEFVREIIDENGFELVHTLKSTEAEIGDLLNDKEPFKKYDLILVDFQLDRGDRGSNIIRNIRDHNVFTDVVFYSQDMDSVREAIREHLLEGVYCSSRNRADFEDKFEKVFLTTIKKIQHISSMRGLVLSETSQLDVLLIDIISRFFNNRNQDDIDALKKYIRKDLIQNSANDLLKNAEKIPENITYEDLLKHRQFDSYKKMRTVGRIIEKLNDNALPSKDLFLREFTEEVIEMRNDLAHVKEEIVEGKSVLQCIKKVRIFDDSECIVMRNNLKKHYKQLNSILEAI